MDIKILKEITKLMKENDLVEVEVESEDLKIKLKKASSQSQFSAPASHLMHHHAPAPAPVAAAAAPVPEVAKPDEFANCKQVISPIPGTVYLRPNPDAANFCQVGTQVDESKVVCLIEAMKVFNEIKPDAGIKGTIKKVLVQDGQAVEYGTVLFLVG
ncbi:MAG: acetyl-CoA carboxylase biotin carboxyl carrier protein [Planctomycetes bacterium]|nr:acetyl-CoA carboxylase biotin carboxyl carrier protein [Planctomycetota bacterium]